MAEAADPCSVQVVSVQPQSQLHQGPSLHNGEEIVFEATCDTKSLLCWIVTSPWHNWSLL